MEKTFKEYLMEWDRADITLQNQHSTQQQAAAQDQQDRTAFSSKMAGSTPVVGDVIQNAAGKFIVVKLSPEGVQVRQLGKRDARVVAVPQQTKFVSAGQAANGKNLFNIQK